ncbi:MAG: DUF1450 domain-containing protein, partial [Tumebacillaceae bacterium]
PDVAVEPADCLDRCGICIRYTYCVINNDFLYANSMNELKEKIVSYIESHRAGMEEAKNFLDQGKTEYGNWNRKLNAHTLLGSSVGVFVFYF